MNRYTYIRKEYTNEQIAYLAGIIDGEGSIYIGNFSSNKVTGAKYYQTNIEVTNTDKNLIDWLVNIFGGRSYAYTKSQTPKNSRKPVYRWIASGERVTHLCEIMMPYLVCKKRQAEIMIKMRKTYDLTGMKIGRPGTTHLTDEILAIRQSYFDEMRSLHVRNYTDFKQS